MENFPSCFLIFAISSLFFHSIIVKSKVNTFTIDLIHRNSKFSPFYNKSATSSELHREDALNSLSRAKRFSQSSCDQENIESSMLLSDGAYLMKISIGTPPVESYAIADTGSDLVWTQCNCIQCYPQNTPPFNPATSSSYRNLGCDTSSCQALLNGKHECGATQECLYVYRYGDGTSITHGNLATETFTFESANGQTAPSFSNSTFGCGRTNTNTFRGSGIVGLGRGPNSLISRLGDEIQHTFSYCLAPKEEGTKSKLRFGKTFGNGFVSTPLLPRGGGSESKFYILNLEGASVNGGGRIVNRETNPSKGNIIIDSGTSSTYLEPQFYNDLEVAVRQAVGLSPVQDPYGTNTLCYDRLVDVEIVFHFTGADVTLNTVNIFVQVNSNLFCMAIVQATNLSVIFGNVAQINYHVEYDLVNELVSFAPQDCSQF